MSACSSSSRSSECLQPQASVIISCSAHVCPFTCRMSITKLKPWISNEIWPSAAAGKQHNHRHAKTIC
ncbi:hypothetical protein RHECNPAF_1330035 [Rhizobium etli CNPAF512]|nr:hypothetical protein RHECNPAF_1330035 [Rhizobium etli CNPAF512]